jgi:hypothetical protein
MLVMPSYEGCAQCIKHIPNFTEEEETEASGLNISFKISNNDGLGEVGVRESWVCSQSSVRHVTGGALHSYTTFPSRAWPKRQPQLCESQWR